MTIGIDQNGKRVSPYPGGSATCQICEDFLVAKCGEIYTWHWAHKNERDCDPWKEHETEWHLKWKNRFPADWQERPQRDTVTGEKHIADIFNSRNDLVIEFQNSPIDIKEMQAREKFYKKMLWVVNAKKFDFQTSSFGEWNYRLAEKLKKLRTDASKIRFLTYEENIAAMSLRKYQEDREVYKEENKTKDVNDSYVHYTWSMRRKVWDIATLPVFFDLGDEIVWIKSQFIAKRVPLDKFMKKYGE